MEILNIIFDTRNCCYRHGGDEEWCVIHVYDSGQVETWPEQHQDHVGPRN